MTNVLCIVSLHSARRALWNEIKSMADDAGVSSRCEFNETSMRCTLPDGLRIFLAGCGSSHDVDKLRGITWDEVLVDEAVNPSLRRELGEVLAPRLTGRFTTLLNGGEFRTVISALIIKQAVKARDHALDVAWGLIANASGGDWTKQSAEWRDAAARWRDEHYVADDVKAAKLRALNAQHLPDPLADKPFTRELIEIARKAATAHDRIVHNVIVRDGPAPSAPAPDDWKQKLATHLRAELHPDRVSVMVRGGSADNVRTLVHLIEDLERPESERFGRFAAGLESGAGIREP